MHQLGFSDTAHQKNQKMKSKISKKTKKQLIVLETNESIKVVVGYLIVEV